MGKTNVKVAKPKSGLTFFQKVKRSRILLLMCLPAILFFIAFSYAPLPGIWEIQLQKWYFWKQVRGVTELRIPGSVR